MSLRSPSGNQTRPSSARLRQGIFNVLRHFRWADQSNIVDGAVVVDLFSGTGAWGIEAMSNGAAEVWFVESHALALRTLQENLNTATESYRAQGLEVPRVQLLKRDLAVTYDKLPKTRLMFCDPPYDKGWFSKVLALETEHNRIVAGGLLLYEASTREEVPVESPTLKRYDTKIYGDSSVHFFVKTG